MCVGNAHFKHKFAHKNTDEDMDLNLIGLHVGTREYISTSN